MTINPETTSIIFNVDARTLVVGMFVLFCALLAIIWKGKKEIGDTVKEELAPLKNTGTNIVNAITEVQTILRNKFKGLSITHNLIEKPGSPLRPTEYDVQEKARELLVGLKDDSIFNPVKNWIYNNPTDIEVILKVGGLWLRDDFMNKPRSVNSTNVEENP